MKTIHHLVDVDAQPERVWRALTDATELASWWSTKVDAPGASVGTQIVWTFAGDFNPVMEITVADEARSSSGSASVAMIRGSTRCSVSPWSRTRTARAVCDSGRTTRWS